MFKEYNAHPKGIKTTDCVARAISTAMDKDYVECRRELNQKKREWSFTSYKDTEFLYKYFEGKPRLIFKAVKSEPRIKGSDFCELHPKGTYILKMAGHVTVGIDGVILDTWDCSYRSVYTAWKID
ncbi:MAG: hypothetical protein GX228_11165 [Firmicutes bacterium]|jgi:hypothetical protein|nr:hypothetical protein [Bacillota bacterium]